VLVANDVSPRPFSKEQREQPLRFAPRLSCETRGIIRTTRSNFLPGASSRAKAYSPPDMISHEHRCIFVHIPKTAGNSINRVFGVDWQDHKDLQRYATELPDDTFRDYFKFAVVRNPWDRVFSDYNYQVKKSREKESKLHVFTESGTKRSFAEWLEMALTDSFSLTADRWGGSVSPHIHRWSPQVDWISLGGQIAVDYVARLENLDEDFQRVCARLSLDCGPLPRRNRRFHRHYSYYYDGASRRLVEKYYIGDIEAFGYQFERRSARIAVKENLCRKVRTVSSPTRRVIFPAVGMLVAACLMFLFVPVGDVDASESETSPAYVETPNKGSSASLGWLLLEWGLRPNGRPFRHRGHHVQQDP
jgi:hypothetical protein